MNSVTFTIKALVCVNVRRTILVLGAGLGLLLVSLPLFSQANQGTIQGGVFDQSGGAIVGATVTVIDVARGVSRPLTTDSAGAYTAPNLIPGMYTVRGGAKGFRNLERSNVLVEVGQTIRVDLVMQPGEQTQTVTVTSETPAIDTTDVTLGGTINQQAVVELPLNGRDFRNLIILRPGVSSVPGGAIGGFSANGSRGEDVGYLIDGLRADEVYTGFGVVNSPNPAGNGSTVFPVDAIQEINNEENPKAEFGWKPGAIINVGVKSGTNDLHGTAFAFGRDDAMDARNYFNAPPNPVAPLALEQFGGNAGGRIRKDKLFWFADYEGVRYTLGSIAPASLPATVALTPTNVAGSLVDACEALKTSGTTISPLSAQIVGLNTATCVVAPQNFTPGANESFYPANSLGPTAQTYLNTIGTSQQDQGIGKIDYRPNDHHSINGMYFYGNGTIFPAATLGIPGSSSSLANGAFGGTDGAKAQLWSGAWNWTPSSTKINEFRVGYDRFTQLYASLDHNVNPLAYGLNTGVTNPAIYGFPTITISSNPSIAQLGGGQYKLVGPDGSLQFLEHFSLVRGNHNFKFGGEYIYNRVNSFQTQSGKGTISFQNLTNFLKGSVNSASILEGTPKRTLSDGQYALFAQDDWRIHRNVMLNLGLRWEYTSVISEAKNLIGGFNPNVGLVQENDPVSSANSVKSIYGGDHRDFSPRIGVAWDVNGNGRTVVRAGGSIMYSYLPFISFVAIAQSLGIVQDPTGAVIQTQGACAAGCAPVGTMLIANLSPLATAMTTNWQNQTAACITAAESGGDPTCGTIFPSGPIKCGDGLTGTPVASPCVAPTVDPNFHNPRIYTWTLGVQRALTNNLTLDASYVGSHSSTLAGFLDINQAPYGSGFTAAQIAAGDPKVGGSTLATTAVTLAEQAARPFYSKYPYLSYIDQLTNNNRSNYDSLQLTLTQRTSHGLSFLASYVFAHTLDDDASDTAIFVPQDSRNPQLQYGNSDFDVRQRFTFSTTYAIPGIKAPGQILRGWQLNSLITFQTPLPWGPVDKTNDLTGNGEVNNTDAYGNTWNFSGNAHDFIAQPVPMTCWSGSGTAKIAGCTLTTEPQQCMTAASAISANTLAATNSIGCYIEGSSVLFPAALGTNGDAGRNVFRGLPYRNWDLSVTKDWKFKERYDTQFRAEFFNVLNHPSFFAPTEALQEGAFYNPALGPGGSNQFGCSCKTPDQGRSNPVFGTGGNREIQLGLKLIF